MLTTMLVEDSVPSREVVRDQILSQFSSVKVIEASDGKEAFKGRASYPTDLIFMDISLPGQNGIELTKEIKTGNQNVAVVMLSGHESDDYRKAAFQSGANGFIGKDSVDVEGQISRVVSCFLKTKEAGRLKPACLLI